MAIQRRQNNDQGDKLILFFEQIKEDLVQIKQDFSYVKETTKDEYAFLFWLLLKLYHLDESQIVDHITENRDDGIDCYAHYPENKELYIIQSKFYEPNNRVTDNDFTSFCKRPFDILNKNKYKRSQALQDIYNKAKNDIEYKIFFQFYTTSRMEGNNIASFISTTQDNFENGAYLDFQYINLEEIYKKYWGNSYQETKNLVFSLETVNKGTYASLRKDYGITELEYDAYYIFVKVSNIFDLKTTADKNRYNLFDENIREFLGENSINRKIIDTLKDQNERKNFAFYNNGITLICEKVDASNQDAARGIRSMPVHNPQIVNGCQTVNAISKVLSKIPANQIKEDYKGVYVLVKVLVVDQANDKHKKFYSDVVRYTNSQNAIPGRAFAINKTSNFVRLQEEFRKRGFLLKVKQSDTNKFKELKRNDRNEYFRLVQRSKEYLRCILGNQRTQEINELDIIIDLERLLQVIITFTKGGYVGFTQKNRILKPESELFKKYSICIQDYISTDNMIKLYYLYWRADKEKRKSDYERRNADNEKQQSNQIFVIPYYMLGFLGYHIDKKNRENKLDIDKMLSSRVFNDEHFEKIYKYLLNITNLYSQCFQRQKKLSYNDMIKLQIDENILQSVIENDRSSSITYGHFLVADYLRSYSE